jgi:hypothetical protein
VDPLLQVFSLDELHGDEEHSLGFADLVDGGDVRMGDGGRELAFAQEPPSGGFVVQEVSGEHFEGDGASEEEILRFEDDAHSPGADPLGNLEVTDYAPRTDIERKSLRAHGDQLSVISRQLSVINDRRRVGNYRLTTDN